MLEQLVDSVIDGADLTPDQLARVKEAAAAVAAQMGPLDLLAAMGTLMGAKRMVDAGDTDGALASVRALTDRYGVSDLVDEIAAQKRAATA